jgi:hypothetical protein
MPSRLPTPSTLRDDSSGHGSGRRRRVLSGGSTRWMTRCTARTSWRERGRRDGRTVGPLGVRGRPARPSSGAGTAVPLSERCHGPCGVGAAESGRVDRTGDSADRDDRGRGWVVDAESEAFFDRSDHAQLLDLMAKRIRDRRMLKLLRPWLEAGVVEDGEIRPTGHADRPRRPPGCGDLAVAGERGAPRAGSALGGPLQRPRSPGELCGRRRPHEADGWQGQLEAMRATLGRYPLRGPVAGTTATPSAGRSTASESRVRENRRHGVIRGGGKRGKAASGQQAPGRDTPCCAPPPRPSPTLPG